ncbi:MAG: hypothetical protein KME42_03470 [Tildeniella nuda ZEHNDER 1965/U140]|nr:hypothetical protein [Tildeniella nuda ZEHNDER 1965/U140]
MSSFYLKLHRFSRVALLYRWLLTLLLDLAVGYYDRVHTARRSYDSASSYLCQLMPLL